MLHGNGCHATMQQGERKHDPIVMILVLQLVLFPKKKCKGKENMIP